MTYKEFLHHLNKAPVHKVNGSKAMKKLYDDAGKECKALAEKKRNKQ